MAVNTVNTSVERYQRTSVIPKREWKHAYRQTCRKRLGTKRNSLIIVERKNVKALKRLKTRIQQTKWIILKAWETLRHKARDWYNAPWNQKPGIFADTDSGYYTDRWAPETRVTKKLKLIKVQRKGWCKRSKIKWTPLTAELYKASIEKLGRLYEKAIRITMDKIEWDKAQHRRTRSTFTKYVDTHLNEAGHQR